jgi:hypothetical protein
MHVYAKPYGQITSDLSHASTVPTDRAKQFINYGEVRPNAVWPTGPTPVNKAKQTHKHTRQIYKRQTVSYFCTVFYPTVALRLQSDQDHLRERSI